MYAMMMRRNELKWFETIQDCIDAMIENGYKHRSPSFVEGNTMYCKSITIDEDGNVTVGRKRVEHVFSD